MSDQALARDQAVMIGKMTEYINSYFDSKECESDKCADCACAHVEQTVASSCHKEIKFGLIHGETPRVERDRLCQESNVILTNPDMLHCTILPQVCSCWQIF